MKRVIIIPTKERIIQAANDVAVRDGVINLTLDAVAKEAGLSKGGLLYHFPTKEALVAALVDHFARHFENTIDDAQHAASPGAGTFTRSFIEATFEAFPMPRGVHAGLLTAILLNPELLEDFRAKFTRWHEQIQDDGLDPTMASLLRYAADGIWASELLGLAPPSDELRQQLRDLMLRLARAE